MPQENQYIAIDLKSFYASQECVSRGLDPLTTHLVVADESRTEKTICLAVTPALKALGVPGRPRLFEVSQRVREINAIRRECAPGKTFSGKSSDDVLLKKTPSLSLDVIIARPRMAMYIECSTRIYRIYLKYVAPEDIHIYSIDEVFINATPYLKLYGLTAYEFSRKLIREILSTTGITATAGIGTNLYLCKVAMDIVAKRCQCDEWGVRIASLDEMSYRDKLWAHRPLTDFWRVGKGYARKLESHGLFTMGDIAQCSLEHEDLLYRLFGINAELLIDHAWGWESCTIRDIHNYRPHTSSLSSGQVLSCPYAVDKARLIVREMTDSLVLDLVEKGLATDSLVLTVGYDRESLQRPGIREAYTGPITTDRYGRQIPRHSQGTANLPQKTASTRLILQSVMALFDRIVAQDLLVRRLTITACHIVPEEPSPEVSEPNYQIDLFRNQEAHENFLQRERQQQQVVLAIRRKYGKNAILRGMNLEDGATAVERNSQIGGHKA